MGKERGGEERTPFAEGAGEGGGNDVAKTGLDIQAIFNSSIVVSLEFLYLILQSFFFFFWYAILHFYERVCPSDFRSGGLSTTVTLTGFEKKCFREFSGPFQTCWPCCSNTSSYSFRARISPRKWR